MFKGNEAQLNFLRKKSSEYYRGIVDDVTVVYDVNRSRVKVYKFNGEKFSLVAENVEVSSKLSVDELAEVLLSFDRTW